MDEKSAAVEKAERTSAEKSGRNRLGDFVGAFSFTWKGTDEMYETVTLNLESDGSFTLREVTGLDKTLTDTQDHHGKWEVAATSPEILLYEEGLSTPDKLQIEGET